MPLATCFALVYEGDLFAATETDAMSNNAPNIALKVAYRLGRKAGLQASQGDARGSQWISLEDVWPCAQQRMPLLAISVEARAAYAVGFHDGYAGDDVDLALELS